MLTLLFIHSLQELVDYQPSDVPNLRILGRTPLNEINFYWTGSGVELNFSGTEIWVILDVNYTNFEPWLAVLENDILTHRLQLQKGRNEIPLFRGFDPSTDRNIKILRETQANPETIIRLVSIRADGDINPLPPNQLKIEYVGDSLGSAEGSYGSAKDTEWLPTWFSASYNYLRLSAHHVNAEFRILSQSGLGVYSQYNNNAQNNMPKYYEQICSVGEGVGANNDNWDFQKWTPDVVVVALGASDRAALLEFDPYTDPETGQVFKSTPALIENAAYNFLVKIRSLNRNARLIWVFFEGDTAITPLVENAVQKFRVNDDPNADVILIPDLPGTGARDHPGINSHIDAGKALGRALADLLKLEYYN